MHTVHKRDVERNKEVLKERTTLFFFSFLLWEMGKVEGIFGVRALLAFRGKKTSSQTLNLTNEKEKENLEE